MIPLGIFLTIVFSLVVMFSSRRWAALGVMAAVCYITEGQELLVFGFNFTVVRIVLLVGFVRIAVRGEYKEFRLNPVDKILLVFVTVQAALYTLRIGTGDALVSQVGQFYNVFLSYFVFRCFLRNYEEVVQFLSGLALLIVPLAACLAVEAATSRNIFRIFGGVLDTSEVRNGGFRGQGPFRSPITAGTFGATLVPLFVNSYVLRKYRRPALIGFTAATVITIASHSSGPLMAYVSGVCALLLWSQRKRMRMIRWGIVMMFLALAAVMKAPVWFIIARIGELTGGSAWYRSALIDAAVNHFGSWWLMGTSDTADWMPFVLSSQYAHADITNQYLAAAVTGGLLAMVLFVWILVRCFRFLGLAIRKLREESSDAEKLFWGMGCALFAHTVNFFAICYFDQMWVAWYLLLAMISSASAEVLKEKPDMVVRADTVADGAQDLSLRPF